MIMIMICRLFISSVDQKLIPFTRLSHSNLRILCVIFKVIIVISTSFLGAFWCINGIDYYLENSRALYYSVNILHGKWKTMMLLF